jgi:deoxyribonuclease (pyrimidine dimer)
MTRINLVNPNILTSRHLVAEYKELTQIIYPMTRTAIKGNLESVKIPEKFCLNGGHVKFFYDKAYYLEKRYIALNEECKRRNVKINDELFGQHLARFKREFPVIWYKDWNPDQEAYDLIIERITERLLQKPHLYPDMSYFLECSKIPEKYLWP